MKQDLRLKVETNFISLLEFENAPFYLPSAMILDGKEENKIAAKSFISLHETLTVLFEKARKVANSNHDFSNILRDTYGNEGLKKLNEYLEETKEILKNMEDFWSQHGNLNNPADHLRAERNSLIEKFEHAYEQLTASSNIIFEKIETRSFHNKIFEQVNSNSQALNILSHKETQVAISRVENDYFDIAASNHSSAAHLWLLAGFAFTIITASLAHHLYLDFKIILDTRLAEKETYDAPPLLFIGTLLSKFLFVSLLIFFNLWIFGNYKFNKYNELKSRHRSAALNSFEHLLKGAGADLEVKKTILKKVSSLLYDHHDIGYLKEKSITSKKMNKQ